MTIRELTIGELSLMERLGNAFYEEGRPPGPGFNYGCWLHHWKQFYDTNKGRIFGAFTDDGELAGAVSGLLSLDVNTAATTVTELFLYIFPEFRRGGLGAKLFDALETWAREQGAEHLNMVALESCTPDAFAKLYISRGFRPVERWFSKELAA